MKRAIISKNTFLHFLFLEHMRELHCKHPASDQTLWGSIWEVLPQQPPTVSLQTSVQVRQLQALFFFEAS